MSRYVSTIESVFREQVGPAAQLATKHVREGATSAAEIVENTDYKAHALNAAQYTMDHPYWIAGMAASLVPVIAPAAVGGSVLGIAGFSATGPVSGRIEKAKLNFLLLNVIQGVLLRVLKPLRTRWLHMESSQPYRAQQWVVMAPPVFSEQYEG